MTKKKDKTIGVLTGLIVGLLLIVVLLSFAIYQKDMQVGDLELERQSLKFVSNTLFKSLKFHVSQLEDNGIDPDTGKPLETPDEK